MMVEARKDDDRKSEAHDAAADLSRFAQASAKLIAEQTSVMAVMTAYGMSVAAQMTSMMLGALQGPTTDGATAATATPSAEPKAAPAEREATAKVVPLRTNTPAAPEAVVAVPIKIAAKAAAKPANALKASPAKPQASKPTRPTAKATSAAPALDGDDLKKISGIGPRLEQELHARGIRHYAEVATLSKAAVKKLDSELGLEGRIVRDDWAGQAKALSGGKG